MAEKEDAMSDKKMKHLWMVEDYPARGERAAGSYWTKIGVAFENRDGSYSLELSAIPVHGKLQMRDPSVKREEAAVPATAGAVQ